MGQPTSYQRMMMQKIDPPNYDAFLTDNVHGIRIPQDRLKIADSWTFESASVAKNFDAHVQEQLPWYGIVTRAVTQIAREYIPERGLVYDIGASTGNIGLALKQTITDRIARLVAIEPSVEMVRHYRASGEVHCTGAEEFDYEPFDCAIAMLSFMFVPLEYRTELWTNLAKSLKPGGAIVCVDKTYPPHGRVGTTFRRVAWDFKRENGASGEEIVRKELSLSGIQIPIRVEDWLDHFKVTKWFQMGEFGGWVLEKRE